MNQAFKLEIAPSLASRVKKWDWILYGIWCLLSAYSYHLYKRNTDLFILITTCIIVILRFLPKKAETNFVEISGERVRWQLSKDIPKVYRSWAEIEWIKFEKDVVSFYEKNSFNNFLSTESFTQAQKEKLNKAITEIASEKNIRLEH
ncbi:hypothetical protein ACFOW1_04375 [Parasediminibacterium paludis]|uniref:YcxB-like protein n=1 Tax=Parasediminibacterium paludis TaxID=908966 RepID=A0ABV8PW15_9BACT